MTTKKVVITDYEFPNLDHEKRIAAESGAELSINQTRDAAELARITKDADVVLDLYAPITREVLAGLAPGATVIRYGMGYDTIDVEAATELGVRVCNVPDYGGDTVADHTVMLALAAMRKLLDYQQVIAGSEGGWLNAADVGPVVALEDAIVGLVGTGQIGRKVAKRLQGFGATIIAYDPYAKAEQMAAEGITLVELDELVARADLVSLHAPLTDETRHIINAERIAAMKPTAVIVNTARGPLVDTVAAAKAVNDDLLGGLGFDVFESEPLEADHPLRTAKRTLLTPHAAYYSGRSLNNLQQFAAEEMGRAVRGEALRCQVNRSAPMH